MIKKILCLAVITSFVATTPVYALTESDLDAIVNDTPSYDSTEGAACGISSVDSVLIGKDNPEKSFNFFVGKGLTPEQSAGIIGNLMQESSPSIDPGANNTAAKGSSISPSSIIPGETFLGGGIAQWEDTAGVPGRWTGQFGLLNYVAGKGGFSGKPKGDGTDWKVLGYQLEFIWWELHNTRDWALEPLLQSATVEEATLAFLKHFEGASIPHTDTRVRYAKDVFALYAGTSGGNLSVGGATSSGCSGGILGDIPMGSTQELARQILDSSPNMVFQTAETRRIFEPVASTGQQTKTCDDKDNDGIYYGMTITAEIDSTMLGIMLAVSQKYEQVVLGVLHAGHHCSGGAHQKGKAIDLNGFTPFSGSGGTGNYIRPGSKNAQGIKNPVIKGSWGDWDNPLLKEYYEDLGRLLSSSGGGGLGQINCFPLNNTPQFFPNVTYFSDTCHHIHLDRRGT